MAQRAQAHLPRVVMVTGLLPLDQARNPVGRRGERSQYLHGVIEEVCARHAFDLVQQRRACRFGVLLQQRHDLVAVCGHPVSSAPIEVLRKGREGLGGVRREIGAQTCEDIPRRLRGG